MANASTTLDRNETNVTRGPLLIAYFAIGILLGILFIKSEVVSWFRIQEMFRFQSFHMYGIIGSALFVSLTSMQLMKRFGRTLSGDRVNVEPKKWERGYRYWIGGSLFGVGWALTGACPGPIFALIAGGVPVFIVVLAGAVAGTWAYGMLRPHLPH
jgi:uncharacterized protein